MPINVKDGGVWKPADIFVKNSGNWSPVQNGYVRDGGVWKPFYNAEAVVVISSNSNGVIGNNLFDNAIWTSNTPKRIIINSGVTVGPSSTWGGFAFQGGEFPTATWGGTLTLENRGTIVGVNGAAGTENSGVGGVGGNAIFIPSETWSKKAILENYGQILAGGGGGGGGGQGGAGTATIRQPASGSLLSSTSPFYMWMSRAWAGTPGASPSIMIVAYNAPELTNGGSGVLAYATGPGGTPPPLPSQPIVADGWNYYLDSNNIDGSMAGIYRTQSSATTGGNGGSGGRGQGYSGAQAAGSSGSAGGTNAGNGGTGGTGGTYGVAGTAGSTGADGNNGSGVAGGAGGLAGYAYKAANVEVAVNEGTILGRIA